MARVQRSFRGPGSKGFLPKCEGTFAITNNFYSTGDMSAFPWGLGGGGVAAPSITHANATGPDGAANVADTLMIPTVTGAANSSTLYQQVNETFYLSQFAQIWARISSGASNGTVSIAFSNASGGGHVSQAIPADGRWHQVTLFYSASQFSSTVYFAVGIDLRDPKQSASSGPIAVQLYQPQLVNNRGPGGKPWPYLASSSSTKGTGNVTVQAPRSIAFRDFSKLKPYSANPVTTANPAEAWQAGGIAHQITGKPVGGKYYAWANSTNTTNHDDWTTFSLYSGPSPFKLTEVSGSSPILQIPGSNYNTGTRGSVSGLSYYMLKPWQSPTGCTIGGTHYEYCQYFSAMGTDNKSSVFMAFSNSVTGPYTWYPNNTTPVPLIDNDGVPENHPYVSPSLVSVIEDDDKLFMYTSHNSNGGSYTNYFSSPKSDGVNWAYEGFALRSPISGVDFNYPDLIGVIDSAVHRNKYGFYEYFAVTYKNNPSEQLVQYSVSDSPHGPWFLYQKPIIPKTSSVYNGSPYWGTITIQEYQGQFILTGNYDNAVDESNTMSLTMLDACN